MKISIVTLTFNSQETIADTVQSILLQDHADIEHIIIDNLSTDNTLEIVRDLYARSEREVKIISERDKGISDGFNKGIEASTGEVIVFLNSDDIYSENNVVSKVANAFADDSIDFVHGDMFFEDLQFGSNRRAPLMKSLEYGMPYNHPTFFVRRRVYHAVGTFDLDYRYAMDFHLICRMYSDVKTPKFKGRYIEDPCFVNMRAGGVSWAHELKALDDVERSLEAFGFVTEEGKRDMSRRRSRVRLKKIFEKLGLHFIVIVWRKLKWAKNGPLFGKS